MYLLGMYCGDYGHVLEEKVPRGKGNAPSLSFPVDRQCNAISLRGDVLRIAREMPTAHHFYYDYQYYYNNNTAQCMYIHCVFSSPANNNNNND